MTSRRPAKKTAHKGRRTAIQARSKATVEAILTAAAQILEREGPEAASTNAIAARAGVSIGSLYQYFGDREAIIAELARRHVEEMRSVLSGALAELIALPLAAAIPRLMAALIASHRVNPTLDGVLHRMMPESAAIMDEFEDFAATVTAAGIRAHPDLHIADPELAGAILTQAVGGVLRTTLRRYPERILDPALERSLVQLVLGYLDRASPPAAG
ncbi:MAG: TetR/AcrR family transcriptional regulator [Myxococcales bacterium]|nr:TetR/AcrR family transcriptional regulator [Myxococcales bacterium]MCB9566120.1 TetR/AcrR family transcriptional regulator [Myxococcales bacterium]MCB9703977.1 TetR/AcrR family transcriptional regulator [Myxococcales bacterium]